MTEATFVTELAVLHLPPETPTDAVALALVGLNVIDRNEGVDGNDLTERETVATMRAIRRSVRLLAAATGVDAREVLGGFYVDECREAVLEPEERTTAAAANLAHATAAAAVA